MYNLWIPIFNREFTKEQLNKTVEQLNRCNPQLILLTFNRILFNKERLAEEKRLFNKNKLFFEDAGFKVGAWLFPTIGYGAPKNILDPEAPYTHLKKLNGEEVGDAYCPLDDDFVKDFCNLTKEIASLNPEVIMFEDDFTFTGGKIYPPEISSCCCERHIERYESILGEKVDVNTLSELIYKNGPNKYRKAWFDMQGEILKSFCAEIEKETHSINPCVRIGLSANSSSYVQEGVGIDVLAKIIAGNTKPFLRMTGAPYWQNLYNYATNIEAIRIQTEWCEEGIELMTEGDTFPRPRHWVSGNKLEFYDMILRADGRSHSILKYMLDYNSSADYETGYIDRHVKNTDTYEEIEKRFVGDTVGLRIFESPEIMKTIKFDEDYPLSTYGKWGYIPLISQQFVTDNSIPVTYQNVGSATLCFGENAKFLDEETLNHGVILDAHAAKILYNKGVDIGINGYSRTKSPNAEYFNSYNETVTAMTGDDSVFYSFDLKDKASIMSKFICTPPGLGVVPTVNLDAFENYPACFKYENAKGQRFMIYTFSAQTVVVNNEGWKSGVFRNYVRQKQLAVGIKWLQKGRALPAMCFKNPELYILCKKDGNSLSVGVWNIFSDEVINPIFELDDLYTEIDCFKCNGKIDNYNVVLDKDIPPYGFVFFTVKK